MKLWNRALMVLVLHFWFGCVLLAASNTKALILDSANEVSQALREGNYEVFVKYCHPTVLKITGGSENMIAMLKKEMKSMKENGTIIREAKATKTSEIFQAGDELHAVVFMSFKIRIPEGELRHDSFMLAISSDEGKSWTFVEGAVLDDDKVKELFPNFNPKLKLPRKKKPVFFPIK